MPNTKQKRATRTGYDERVHYNNYDTRNTDYAQLQIAWQERRNAIIRAYVAGVTQEVLGTVFGCSRQQVSDILRRAGYQLGRKGRRAFKRPESGVLYLAASV